MTPTLNASSRIMWEAAQRLGITCTEFGDRETILMEYHNQRWYTRGSRTSFQSSVGKTIADYKPLTKKILQHFQLPTAASVLLKTETDLESVSHLRFPVVLKPVAGGHGKDVIVGVSDLQAVTETWHKLHQSVLVEEMLAGTEYRIVCVDYHFVAAAFRKPAHVVGDGEHTINQLVDIKNQHPWRGQGHSNNLSLIVIDELVQEYLTAQQLTVDSVPTAGQEVPLRKTANLSTGGEAWDVTDTVSSENRLLFEQIAQACDLNVCGIDVMCQSLTKSLTIQPQAGVIEVNASPGLRMHHYPMQGTPRDIATIILKSVLQQAPI